MTARQLLVLCRVALRLAGGFVSLAWMAARVSPERRERMVVRWCHGALADLGIRLEARGASVPAQACLVVCNHVSWVDAVALRALLPCGFVAKRSLLGWPVVGRLIALTGGVFVQRETPADLPGALDVIGGRLAAGLSVCIFPEATTTSGREIAPFAPSSFSVAAGRGVHVLPVAVRYFEDDQPSPAMAWVGDEAFLPSLLRIAHAVRPRVTVTIGEPFLPPAGRKEAARQARAAVAALAGLPHGGSAFDHPPGGRVVGLAGSPGLTERVIDHAMAWIARESGSGASDLEPGSTLASAGVDSLDVLTMLAHLESSLGVVIHDRVLRLPLEPTLGEFAAAVAAAARPGASGVAVTHEAG